MANFRIYNETLCPDLWDSAQHLDPVVRLNLLQMARDFYEKTNLPAPIIDVYLMGSIANYNWTEDSDVDVHVIVDYTKLQMPPETANKTVKTAGAQWNLEHEVMVKGHKVEMNIQNSAEQKPYVTGIYSLMKDIWIRKPFKMPLKLDKNVLRFQYESMKKYVHNAIGSGDREQMKAAKKYLDAYRQYGLDTYGELSYENIIFKILRSRGLVKQLKDSIVAVYDKAMTVNESEINEISMGKYKRVWKVIGDKVRKFRDGGGDFDTPEGERLLRFISTLSKNGKKLHLGDPLKLVVYVWLQEESWASENPLTGQTEWHKGYYDWHGMRVLIDKIEACGPDGPYIFSGQIVNPNRGSFRARIDKFGIFDRPSSYKLEYEDRKEVVDTIKEFFLWGDAEEQANVKDLIDLLPKNVSEVGMKDLKSRIPQSPSDYRYTDSGELRMDNMTLDNLVALRSKAARAVAFHKKGEDAQQLARATAEFNRYSVEIKRRMEYINKPITESPLMTKKGKTALAGDKPLRELPLEDIRGNIVVFREPRDNQLIAKGFTLVYFMDSDESAADMKAGKLPYLMVPRGTFYSGGSPITDIWDKKFHRPGTEHILGVIEGMTNENIIYVEMITVRPGWKRNHIAKAMQDVLRKDFPNAKITTSSRTEAGEKLAKGTGIPDDKPEVKEGFGSGIPEKDRLKINNTDGSTRRWQVRSKDAPKTPKMTDKIVIAVPEFDEPQKGDCLTEGLILESPNQKKLKKNRKPLSDEERAEVMKRKAVWHHGPSGEETPAIWKSVVNGKTWYCCNTHRAIQIKPTLKGAIKAFEFIKTTA